MRELEIRRSPIELRVNEDNEQRTIVGQIPYNTESLDLGGFTEIIRPSAFQRSLEGSEDIWALFNHNTDKVMGRRSTGSMKLNSGDGGLSVDISPNNTSYSNDAIEVIRAGDSDGFSFGFFVRQDEWNEDNTVRELVDVELVEVSVVFQPAYLTGNEIDLRGAPEIRVAPHVLQRVKELHLTNVRRLSQKQLELNLKLASL